MSDQTLAFLGRCYDAILAPDGWTAALDIFTESIGAAGGCFSQSGVAADKRVRAPASTRYQAMFRDFIGDGWAPHDMRALRGWPLAKNGQVIVYEDDMTSAEERARLPIYTDLFARHDMSMFAGLGLYAGDQVWSLNLVRAEADGPFSAPAQHAALMALRPALERMLLYAEHLSDAAITGALAAFEHAAIAAIFIDGAGKARLFNARADALLGRDLTVSGGRLTVRGANGSAALATLIDTMLGRDAGSAATAGAQIVLRRAGRLPLVIDAIPVRQLLADAFGRAGCLLLVTDPEAETQADPRLIAGAFNLTQRETEIAGLLRAGRAVPPIAETLGMRASSVQQVIKSILAKTGTNRQAELVALLNRLPPERR